MNRFNLSALAVRERAVTLFLILVLAGSGLFAFFQLGRAEDPAFTIKLLTVSAAWPGASAKEMQDLVAEPLEKRLQELRWYDRVETIARPGLVLMTLTLKDSTPPAAVPEQFYQARKKLGDQGLTLPRGVLGPFINDEYSDVSFALYALKAPGLAPRDLVRAAEPLRQRLLRVPGVKKVDIVGERPERVFVEFSWQRLATLGITARELFAAIGQHNLVTPAGSIETRGPQAVLRLDGVPDDLASLRNIPVAAGGRVLRLGDVATVRRGYEDPASFLIRHDGEPALALSVVMQEGWNGLELGRALGAEAEAIRADLPLGISLSRITDQAINISGAVNEFMLKFVVALAVVMLVCLVSMGWRVGIVVAAAVPLTLATVFVIMLLTGRVFDRVTLGALIISLGLLVDDAIIAIEIMVVKMEEGMARVQAAAYAWSHTAAPMLAGTLVTVLGFLPVGFAKSTAGEYAGNIFWIVGFALITSWVVAVVFTPYLGVKLLPQIAPVAGGHAAIYDTPRYRQLRRAISFAVRRKWWVAGAVALVFVAAGAGMGAVRQQFFPTSDRPEVLVELQLPYGSSIETTSAASAKVEAWLHEQPEARIVTAYVGQGAPRFFMSYNPELPDPSFAKIIVLTDDDAARDALLHRLRERAADGLAPEARVRATTLVFGPPSPFPVAFRVTGPDADTLRRIAADVAGVMRANPSMRDVNLDWGTRQPQLHLSFDADRLALIGLTPQDAAEQLQFLVSGVPVTQLRDGIRTAELTARSAGTERLDPARLGDFQLIGRDGQAIALDQIGHIELRAEEPILRRRDRLPTLTVRGDIDERMQPPEVSLAVDAALAPVRAALPAGYRIEMGASIEEAGKANAALAPIFPVMLVLTLIVLMLQTRSFAATGMTLLTAPLGVVGMVPILLAFNQPFGFNAILGLIGLSGILMRNTLILIGQIDSNRADGLAPFDAVVEATVQRARPVVLTALAAVLAFMPLTESVFWGSLAYTLIGGTAVGTLLILLFLPALYAIWFGVAAPAGGERAEAADSAYA